MTRCTNCGAPNGAEAGRCYACSEPLGGSCLCSRCRAANPENARFCSGCGGALVAEFPGQPAPLLPGERPAYAPAPVAPAGPHAPARDPWRALTFVTIGVTVPVVLALLLVPWRPASTAPPTDPRISLSAAPEQAPSPGPAGGGVPTTGQIPTGWVGASPGSLQGPGGSQGAAGLPAAHSAAGPSGEVPASGLSSFDLNPGAPPPATPATLQPAAGAPGSDLLRPPLFRAPLGQHLQGGSAIAQDLYERAAALIRAASGVGIAEWAAGQASEGDLAAMVRMLSDARLVGDGLYLDAGDQNGGWSISLYGTPAQGDPRLRCYLHGDGLDRQSLVSLYGPPRLEKQGEGGSLLVYGRAAAAYDAAGAFLGTLFFCTAR